MAGPAGAPGATGPAGPQGIQGLQGPKGDPGAPGTLASKSGTYVVQATVWVPGNGGNQATALCNVTKDIVLNGGCSLGISTQGQFASGSFPYAATELDARSGWECVGGNTSSTPFTVTAYVTCLSVP